MAATPKKPYSIGYNGHAHVCDCMACAELRAKEVYKLAMNPRLGGHLHMSRTVYVRSYVVRAHFKRHPNHLNKMPNTKNAVESAIRKALINEDRKGGKR